jgi:hypothetical protein
MASNPVTLYRDHDTILAEDILLENKIAEQHVDHEKDSATFDVGYGTKLYIPPSTTDFELPLTGVGHALYLRLKVDQQVTLRLDATSIAVPPGQPHVLTPRGVGTPPPFLAIFEADMAYTHVYITTGTNGANVSYLYAGTQA